MRDKGKGAVHVTTWKLMWEKKETEIIQGGKRRGSESGVVGRLGGSSHHDQGREKKGSELKRMKKLGTELVTR